MDSMFLFLTFLRCSVFDIQCSIFRRSFVPFVFKPKPTLMRKMFVFCLAAGFAACNSKEAKVDSMSTSGDSTAQDNLSYAYTATYSSKFEMGDPKNSQIILNIWKTWDEGDLSKAKDLFADSVEMHLANGMIDKGPRDSVIAHAQAYRSTLESVTSTVEVFLPTKSVDKNENWVGIWGKEVSKDKKGNIDSSYLQETWRLNKDGKIDFMMQYNRPAAPPKM